MKGGGWWIAIRVLLTSASPFSSVHTMEEGVPFLQLEPRRPRLLADDVDGAEIDAGAEDDDEVEAFVVLSEHSDIEGPVAVLHHVPIVPFVRPDEEVASAPSGTQLYAHVPQCSLLGLRRCCVQMRN